MYSVMIVDDLEIMRLQLKRLKVWGENSVFQIVEEARNGHEALMKLKTNKVDLIITDIRMPIMDGINLIEKIMDKKLADCVVILSEYTDFEFVRKGLKLGAFDYIVKPVNEDEFEELLRKAKIFISEKQQEEYKTKEYNLSNDIDQIVKLIVCGESIEMITYLTLDKITAYEGDIFKTQLTVQSLLKDIFILINKEIPWLKKFAEIDPSEGIKTDGLISIDNLKESFILRLRNLTYEIKNIYFGTEFGKVINQISIFVLENIDSEINLSILSRNLFFNKNYISDLFKEKTGISLLRYITKTKMERAKKLLAENELKNYEIAEKIAYKDTEYFSKLFKKHTNFTPTDFRKQNL
jgi:two-component system response regulator YesN